MAKSNAARRKYPPPGRARKLAEAAYMMRLRGVPYPRIGELLAQGYPPNPSNDPKHRWLWRPGAQPRFATIEALVRAGFPDLLPAEPEQMRQLQLARLEMLEGLLQPQMRGEKVRRVLRDGTIVEVEPPPQNQLSAMKSLVKIQRLGAALHGIRLPATQVAFPQQSKQDAYATTPPEIKEEVERIFVKYKKQLNPKKKKQQPQPRPRPSSKAPSDDKLAFKILEARLAEDEAAGLEMSERTDEPNKESEPNSKK